MRQTVHLSHHDTPPSIRATTTKNNNNSLKLSLINTLIYTDRFCLFLFIIEQLRCCLPRQQLLLFISIFYSSCSLWSSTASGMIAVFWSGAKIVRLPPGNANDDDDDLKGLSLSKCFSPESVKASAGSCYRQWRGRLHRSSSWSWWSCGWRGIDLVRMVRDGLSEAQWPIGSLWLWNTTLYNACHELMDQWWSSSSSSSARSLRSKADQQLSSFFFFVFKMMMSCHKRKIRQLAVH